MRGRGWNAWPTASKWRTRQREERGRCWPMFCATHATACVNWRRVLRSRSWPILTLALGIGATSAMFSVINGVLLRPLPFPEPEALVRVNEIVPQYGRFSVAPATFLDWRAQSTSFERIVAAQSGTASFTGSNGAERINNALVSWDFFDMARVQPVLGRAFTAEEDVPGKNTVVVLSHGMWQQRFGGDRNIVGRSTTLNGAPATIVGVMPAGFAFPGGAEYWAPIALDQAKPTRGGHFLAVVARLKPGVTVAQAGAEMRMISERLAKQYPKGERRRVRGGHTGPRADGRRRAPVAARAARGGRRRRADRLRERRQPAAGACVRA